jgi:hypothetical protein
VLTFALLCLCILLTGFGKSYILAAVVFGLIKSGYRVIFVPDCNELLEQNALEVLQTALRQAVADGALLKGEQGKFWQEALGDEEPSAQKLVTCSKALLADWACPTVLVFDQFNALDANPADDHERLHRKALVLQLLRDFAGLHIQVSCRSGSSRELQQTHHQNADRTGERIPLNGGFTEVRSPREIQSSLFHLALFHQTHFSSRVVSCCDVLV